MVRWMCNVKVKDRVPSKELRERLEIDDIILILQQNRCDGMGMCCEKKTLIGLGEDQRGHGQRLCKKIAKHVI